jgi:hypothetical protein
MKRRRPISLTPSTTTKSAAKKSSVSHSTPMSACIGHTASEDAEDRERGRGGYEEQYQEQEQEHTKSKHKHASNKHRASVARALVPSVCGRQTWCLCAAFMGGALVPRWCIHGQCINLTRYTHGRHLFRGITGTAQVLVYTTRM